MGNFKDLTQQRFGRLVVLSEVLERRKQRIMWNCLCDCGETTIKQGNHLVDGRSKSCGCLHAELAGARVRKYATPLESCKRQYFRIYEKAASNRNLVFELEFVQFVELIKQPCFYCDTTENIILLNGGKPGYGYRFKANGIDRLNNVLGYTMLNSVPCCKRCNLAKGVLSAKDYINICLNVAAKWSTRQLIDTFMESKNTNAAHSSLR